MIASKYIITIIFSLIYYSSAAQFDALKKRIAVSDSFNIHQPKEKIFIHHNQQIYQLNDTVWLKGYILSASDLLLMDSSKIVYIDFFNAAGNIVKRSSTYSEIGIFLANLKLTDIDFNQGQYRLRAYTSHMVNNGDSNFFESRLTIIDPDNLVGNNSNNNQPSANNTRSKKFAQSNAAVHQSLDLQFLPEGGSFIVGKQQRLGFKCLNRFGKGVNVNGNIINSKKETVAIFQSVHSGMGIVEFTPQANEKYEAVTSDSVMAKLPTPQTSGTQLRVTNNISSDSIIVFIDATDDLQGDPYFFRASAQGISCASGLVIVGSSIKRIAIAKTIFPSGICRFTLYDQNALPVNERIILLWHRDQLQINLTTNKSLYNLRDSVQLSIIVNNAKGEPAAGHFSLAVIDTSLASFSNNVDNILSYMLLSSDLKGHIDNPSYYFDQPDPAAVDALMLTQGWVQYDNRIATSNIFQKDFTVSGKVLSVFNKPVEGSKLTLLGKDGFGQSFVSESMSDKSGRFMFTEFPSFTTDSVSLLIKATKKKGSFGGVEVKVDEPVWPGPGTALAKDLIDPSIDNNITQSVTRQAALYDRIKKSRGYLQAVIVKSKLKVKGSKNLNADGGADYVITKKTIDSMPQSTLLDLLQKSVKGFHAGTLRRNPLQLYKANGDVIIFVIDGYNINQYYDPLTESSQEFILYANRYLKYITADDVAGIEVMNTAKNTAAYEQYYHLNNGLISYTILEITTYSGNGAFYKSVPGTYRYKPRTPVLAKTFYTPRYSTQDSSNADYRSTIHWQPDLITNAKGEASSTFYTSDHPGNYLILIQGTGFNGGLGVGYFTLPVGKLKVEN